MVHRSIFSYQETLKIVNLAKIVYISDDQAHSVETDTSRKQSNRQRFLSWIQKDSPVTSDNLIIDEGAKSRAKNCVLHFLKSDSNIELIEETEYVPVESIVNIDPDRIQKNLEGDIDIPIAFAVDQKSIIVNHTHEFILHNYKNRSSITSLTF